MIAKYDRELTALDGLGLSDVEMDLTLTLLNEYVWAPLARRPRPRWWNARAA